MGHEAKKDVHFMTTIVIVLTSFSKVPGILQSSYYYFC